jgi:CheY-like chemotaxis protein
MKKPFILIVNDDPNSCKLFQTYCRLADYDAIYVLNAEEALETFTTRHPDLIILDMKLPGMDGMAFLRTLKTNPTTDTIRVVVTTVYNECYNQKQVLEAGADGFLIVPNRRELIMKLVTETISDMLKGR